MTNDKLEAIRKENRQPLKRQLIAEYGWAQWLNDAEAFILDQYQSIEQKTTNYLCQVGHRDSCIKAVVIYHDETKVVECCNVSNIARNLHDALSWMVELRGCKEALAKDSRYEKTKGTVIAGRRAFGSFNLFQFHKLSDNTQTSTVMTSDEMRRVKIEAIKEERDFKKQRTAMIEYGLLKFLNDIEAEVTHWRWDDETKIESFLIRLEFYHCRHNILINSCQHGKCGNYIFLNPALETVYAAHAWLVSDLTHMQFLKDEGHADNFCGQVWRGQMDGHFIFRCSDITN